MRRNFLFFAAISIGLSACGLFPSELPPYQPCYRDEPCCPQDLPERQKAQKEYVNEEETISLQNLTSRVIVHCYTTDYLTAEKCAQLYEKEGFVRFREIPYKTADYDLLKKNDFPTRRWRGNERTPRW